ncbi:MAG: KamA family radical SAM protein [Sedimentisphaerales bacterium]|nr:KamA family radical SAM protein [Sedimentisphaerales bacterium]
MKNVRMKYYTDIKKIEQLSETEKEQLAPVTKRYIFRANDYYLSLIDWSDPDDPIRKIVIPHIQELQEWGRLDPSDEQSFTVLPGVEHKYNSTVLLLVSNVCEGICRYCFRKRVFINRQTGHLQDLPAALNYIKEHEEVTNVLMTGGDPFSLKTSRLEEIISRLRRIEHVQIIRIGTRMPAFNPYRIIDDTDLPKMIETYSSKQKRIYIMTHFVHPREITEQAVEGVDILIRAGAILANQTPLIRGVNDEPETLARLFAELSFIGVPPYYVFQCRPASGNKAYTVPIEQGYEIFEKAKAMVSGLAKRARFVMSHSSGKIEIVGRTADKIYFKYHRAAQDEDSGLFLACKSNPDAYWLDDYEEFIAECPVEMPYRSYGPE